MTDKEENKPEKTEKPAEVSELDKLKADLEKARKDYHYLMAEFDTYRRNAIKERSDLTKFGSERFIREFLNVFDNFERALESEVTADTLNVFRDGVALIATEFKSLLQRHHVAEVESEGQPFDPAKHEALSSEARADLPAGAVARVFKKAYKLHDKLIRPAQVTVASAPSSAD